MKLKTVEREAYQKLIVSLIEFRKSAGLSQSDLAVALGCSQSDISKIENCERRLDVLEFAYILKVISPESGVEIAVKVFESLFNGSE